MCVSSLTCVRGGDLTIEQEIDSLFSRGGLVILERLAERLCQPDNGLRRSETAWLAAPCPSEWSGSLCHRTSIRNRPSSHPLLRVGELLRSPKRRHRPLSKQSLHEALTCRGKGVAGSQKRPGNWKGHRTAR